MKRKHWWLLLILTCLSGAAFAGPPVIGPENAPLAGPGGG